MTTALASDPAEGASGGPFAPSPIDLFEVARRSTDRMIGADQRSEEQRRAAERLSYRVAGAVSRTGALVVSAVVVVALVRWSGADTGQIAVGALVATIVAAVPVVLHLGLSLSETTAANRRQRQLLLLQHSLLQVLDADSIEDVLAKVVEVEDLESDDEVVRRATLRIDAGPDQEPMHVIIDFAGVDVGVWSKVHAQPVAERGDDVEDGGTVDVVD